MSPLNSEPKKEIIFPAKDNKSILPSILVKEKLN